MEKFVLPEKWYVIGGENPEIKNAWNQLNKDKGQSSNYNFQEDCFYFLRNNEKTYSRSEPIGYMKITHDEFMKYVINKETSQPFIQTNEYNQILIKLLINE